MENGDPKLIATVLADMKEIAEDLYLNKVTNDDEDDALEKWITALETRLKNEGRLTPTEEMGGDW